MSIDFCCLAYRPSSVRGSFSSSSFRSPTISSTVQHRSSSPSSFRNHHINNPITSTLSNQQQQQQDDNEWRDMELLTRVDNLRIVFESFKRHMESTVQGVEKKTKTLRKDVLKKLTQALLVK